MGEKIEISRETIIETLDQVVSKTKTNNFVVMGSTALTASYGEKLSPKLRLTTDIDLISSDLDQRDPVEVKELNILTEKIRAEFGAKSEFHTRTGFEVSLVPRALLLNAPKNWEARCSTIELPSGGEVKVLDPYDLACSKLTATRTKDAEWLVEAIESKAIEIPQLSKRLESCNPGMLQAKEEDIKAIWAKVHADLKGRGVVCCKEIFPETGRDKGMGI